MKKSVLKFAVRNAMQQYYKSGLTATAEQLQSDLARCKSERLGAEDILDECRVQLEYLNEKFKATGTTNSILARITAFRASQQTQEGKGLLSSSEQGKCRICGGNDCDSDSHK